MVENLITNLGIDVMMMEGFSFPYLRRVRMVFLLFCGTMILDIGMSGGLGLFFTRFCLHF